MTEYTILATHTPAASTAKEVYENRANIVFYQGPYESKEDGIRGVRYCQEKQPELFYSVWQRDEDSGELIDEGMVHCNSRGPDLFFMSDLEINEYIAEEVMKWHRGHGLKWVDNDGVVMSNVPNFMEDANWTLRAIGRLDPHRRQFISERFSFVSPGEQGLARKLAWLLICALSI